MGIKYGGDKEWDFIWNQFRQSQVATEQRELLVSLSCSNEVWILNRYMKNEFM